jgi:uncharacterized protein YjiS (DUF1127 family)
MTAIHLQPCGEAAGSVRRHAALDALSDASNWVLASLRLWRQRQRERDQLATFDERMLADIGLSRSDAEFLSNKPFWRE